MAMMTGPQKVRKACALAAGWGWCDEHQSARYGGSEPCDSLHAKPERPNPVYVTEGGD